MTDSEQILRVTRSDSDDNFVLLNVSSNGTEPLDLRIQGTEGAYAYETNIKSYQIANLRDRKSVQTDSQWLITLRTTLLRCHNTQPSDENIEIVATISSSILILIFRKNISGITQRLGEVTLPRDEALELDTIAWTSTAILRGDALEDQLTDLTAQHAAEQQAVSALKQQLEELVAAKEAHENALLSKFTVLLNEKKVKIRDQQRLLAQANARGPVAVPKKETSSPIAPKVAASKRGKRKADDAALDEGRNEVDEEEEEAFEGTASSKRVKDEDMDEDGDAMLQTPEASDEDATEDEDEEEKDDGGKGDSLEGHTFESQNMEVDAPLPSFSDLPPNRELPFENAKVKEGNEVVQRQAQQKSFEVANETDDDDDDEL